MPSVPLGSSLQRFVKGIGIVRAECRSIVRARGAPHACNATPRLCRCDASAHWASKVTRRSADERDQRAVTRLRALVEASPRMRCVRQRLLREDARGGCK
eukprot:4173019-Pleurochrysis_carterae.AAC.1